MHASRLLLPALAAWLSLSAFPAQAQVTGEPVAEMAHYDAFMSGFLDKWNVPGAAVAVAYEGRLVYARGFGMADVEAGAAVQPDARFRIASLSKPVTAVVTMRLVEQGLLGLDDPAFSYLDHLPPLEGQTEDARLAQITVRDLLRHSGGWFRSATDPDPMFTPFAIAEAMGMASPPECPDVIRYMRGQPLDFTPGTNYSYSNFGYCVLGRVIEAVTGQSYEEVAREVLSEAGISGMALARTRLEERMPDEVRYYHFNSTTAPSVFDRTEQVPMPYGGFYIDAMDALGGWTASTVDLLRLMTAVDGRASRPDILQSATLETMTARPDMARWDGSPWWYALGWLNNNNDNWWHDGSLAGTRSLLVRAGNQDLAYAVLLNTRVADDAAFFQELDAAMWNLAGDVASWPVHDFFPRFTGTASESEPPVRFTVSGPFPNPSSARVEVVVEVDEAQHVKIEAFDLLGRRAALLHEGFLEPGSTRLTFNAAGLASGAYVIRTRTADGGTMCRSMIVAK